MSTDEGDLDFPTIFKSGQLRKVLETRRVGKRFFESSRGITPRAVQEAFGFTVVVTAGTNRWTENPGSL